jgi:hypothetical protein
LANAALLVDSYRVDYDILSWGQWIPGWLNYVLGTPVPDAIGTPITIDSQYDATMTLAGITTVAGLVFQLYPVAGLGGVAIVGQGVMCHLMDQVIYGMEQRIFD